MGYMNVKVETIDDDVVTFKPESGKLKKDLMELLYSFGISCRENKGRISFDFNYFKFTPTEGGASMSYSNEFHKTVKIKEIRKTDKKKEQLCLHFDVEGVLTFLVGQYIPTVGLSGTV